MASSKLIKDDLKYTLFSEIYQRLEQPKAKRKALSILRAAISSYAKRGWERVTLDMIAREAGVPRPTILHYFKDASELRIFAIKYIRLVFQKIAVEALMKETHPRAMLEAYIRCCFQWTEQCRDDSRVWLSFLHAASNSKTDKTFNSEAVRAGTDRIAYLLQTGNEAQAFHCPHPLTAAKALQTLITGGMICYASEQFEDDGREFVETIVAHCLAIAGAPQG